MIIKLYIETYKKKNLAQITKVLSFWSQLLWSPGLHHGSTCEVCFWIILADRLALLYHPERWDAGLCHSHHTQF